MFSWFHVDICNNHGSRRNESKGITLSSVISLSSTVLRPPYSKIQEEYIGVHSAYLGKSTGALISNPNFGDSYLIGSRGNPLSLSVNDLAVFPAPAAALLLPCLVSSHAGYHPSSFIFHRIIPWLSHLAVFYWRCGDCSEPRKKLNN